MRSDEREMADTCLIISGGPTDQEFCVGIRERTEVSLCGRCGRGSRRLRGPGARAGPCGGRFRYLWTGADGRTPKERGLGDGCPQAGKGRN